MHKNRNKKMPTANGQIANRKKTEINFNQIAKPSGSKAKNR